MNTTQKTTSTPLKVMIVEDNPDDQELIALSLRQMGEKDLKMFFCETLSTALTEITNTAPDILLLDLSLPDSFGIETVKVVHRRFPSLPIIVLTGNDDVTTALQSIDAGAQDYLTKGKIDTSLLHRSIGYALERQRIAETLKLALAASQMGVWEFSLEDNITSRAILDKETWGSFAEIPNWTARSFLENVYFQDRAAVKKALNNSIVSGKLDLECRVVNKEDKSIRWIALQAKHSYDSASEIFTDSHANSCGKGRMIGTVKDITRAKTLELVANEARERSNQIFHTLIEHAPTGVAMLDSSMKLTSANSVFCELLDEACELLIGRRLDDILPYREIQAASPIIMTGAPVEIARLFAPTPEGNERYWDLSVWPVKVAGQVAGAVLQLNDRTHTVLLERQRDDFVASVAHDIKNPLIGASRLLEALCNDAAQTPSDNHELYLNALKDSNQNLLSLVQNLVDVYRYETLAYPCHLEKIQTATLIESCVRQMTAFAESQNVKLNTQLQAEAEFLYADAIGVRRVLMNLLHNAIKFNKHGGSVTVLVRKNNEKIAISVTDTGNGISEFEQRKLFQRYTQGREGQKHSVGTGLGLYLSKQIINAHRGSISCNSQLGKSTTFTFELPLLHVVSKKYVGSAELNFKRPRFKLSKDKISQEFKV